MEHQGEALRVIFSRNKVKIKDLADRLHISRTTVYTWFDMTIIPYENLEKVSKELNLDIFELMREELGSKSFKKYNPVIPPPTHSSEIDLSEEKIIMQIELDGTSQSLDRLIEKLRVLNQALQSFSTAISH
jgi:transcriptional regulator with XRE-family HTH domain